MARRKTDWFELWFSDKESIINTMLKNMASDLECGYSYFGNSIQNQKRAIDEYDKEFKEQVELLKTLDEEKAQRWCYYDMKKRGVIS